MAGDRALAAGRRIPAGLQIGADAGDPDGAPARELKREWAVDIDSTSCRAHQHPAGARHLPGAPGLPEKGGGAPVEADGREALGRSRGGLTTKVHLPADDRARPLTWLTSPGRRGDSPMLLPVLETLRVPRRGPGRPRRRPDPLRGDKAHSSRSNRAHPRRRRIKATIAEPDDQRANRRHRGRAGGRPPAFDKAQYRRPSVVERCVSKGKQFRSVASHYDKRGYIFNGTLTVTTIVIWLRDTSKSHQERPTGDSCEPRAPGRPRKRAGPGPRVVRGGGNGASSPARGRRKECFRRANSGPK
nr:IS5 family transposase [Streptomyces sp. TSRI0281]